MGDLQWTNDLAIQLMQEYKRRPELWDTTHEMYRVQTLKYETWSQLANMFDCDIADLRKKLNSLFASHRREKAKVRTGGRTQWFLYPYMSFLPNHLECDSSSGEATTNTRNKSKRRQDSKESASSSDDNDNDEDSHSVQEEIHIKEIPVIETYKLKSRVKKLQTHKPRLIRPIKRRVVKEYSSSSHHSIDSRLSEALKLLRRSDSTRKKDECDSFGEYIADSLRKHDERTQAMIKQAINNILFEQEMKKYSNNQYTVILSNIDENPLIIGEGDDDHDNEQSG